MVAPQLLEEQGEHLFGGGGGSMGISGMILKAVAIVRMITSALE